MICSLVKCMGDREADKGIGQARETGTLQPEPLAASACQRQVHTLTPDSTSSEQHLDCRRPGRPGRTRTAHQGVPHRDNRLLSMSDVTQRCGNKDRTAQESTPSGKVPKVPHAAHCPHLSHLLHTSLTVVAGIVSMLQLIFNSCGLCNTGKMRKTHMHITVQALASCYSIA